MCKSYFGGTKSGEKVYKYSLKNEFLEIGILNYGGIITDILMPDKDGKINNIVLGFDNIADYEEKSPYFGCITGRNAGRITNGEFVLNDTQYKLAINNGTNHLHGGLVGLDKKVWDAELLKDKLILTYFSPNGEEGYPGNVNFKVIYTLKGDELILEYEGVTDSETIINLTNHTYFNLTGDVSKGVLGHELFINSDKFAELDKTSAITGAFISVENTPLNFKTLKKIGESIEDEYEQLIIAKGYDHPFILKKDKAVEIIAKESLTGRCIEVETDQPVVIFYSGNYLGEEGILSTGKNSIPRGGFCLETQDIPNYINNKNWNKKIYDKENPYKAKTVYRFSVNGR